MFFKRILALMVSLSVLVALLTAASGMNLISLWDAKEISFADNGEGTIYKEFDIGQKNEPSLDTFVKDGMEIRINGKKVELASKEKKKIKASRPAKKYPRQFVTSRGKTLDYKRVITMRATAYDSSFESCGKRPGERGYGITATGTQVRKGSVAVDPRVIPLGSKLYIESIDGQYIYGTAYAEDTGGAIKGNRIDLFFKTGYECTQFGVRAVRVYVLN